MNATGSTTAGAAVPVSEVGSRPEAALGNDSRGFGWVGGLGEIYDESYDSYLAGKPFV